MMSPIRLPRCVIGASAAVLFALPLAAQSVAQQDQYDPKAILAAERYQKPPAVIDKIVSANRNAAVTLGNPSPDRKWFMKLDSDGLPSLEDFAKGHIYLGGLQVDTLAHRSRALTTRGGHSITLIDAMSGKPRTIETVAGADVSSPTWSPDGKTIAYVANFAKASHIMLLDVATGKSTQLTKTQLNAVYFLAPGQGGGGGGGAGGVSIDWTSDGKSIIAVLVPQPFKLAPQIPAVAPTPIVRLTTEGKIDKERIHPSLLGTPYDKAMLEYYATGQLAVIDLKTRTAKLVGNSAMIRSVSASPDGQYFRVTLMDKPFSYVVATSSFGTEEQLWDETGKVIVQMSKRPLREGAPADSVAAVADSIANATAGQDPMLKGKNILGWNPNGPGMLVVMADPTADSIAQAAAAAAALARGGRGTGGGGRGGRGAGGSQASVPTKLAAWMPPFGANDFHDVYASSGRIGSATYTPDGKTLFLGVGNQNYAMRLADTTKHFALQNVTLGAGGGRGGRGGGAGGGRGRGGAANPLLGTVASSRGFVAIGSDNKTVYLSGNKTPGANWEKEGPVSWVDKLDIETGNRSRVFEGAPGTAETVVAALDDDYSKVVVSRETPTEVPNSYLVDVKAGTRTKLTNNVDLMPEVTQAIRKRLWATRPDGFRFEVDVTLPKDYKEGTKLPGIIWFYPTEVSTQESYDTARQATNINRYPVVGPRSAEIWTTQGYVVIQPQAIPVFGPQGSMNDHYVEELRDGLYATIETVVNAGYLDRDRVGLWGHSYGAFSTVNAMVHTKWFKAGIAGDGMYNRSLTPYGFQNERRDFWTAQETYLKMSPFFYANQLSGALLMYHQVEDQNEGTDPISSIRMFHALLGQGKTAALFMYPYEDHGPATKETDLDQWARFVAWMDLYLKNPKPKAIVP
jgi:dipeptidyl aminopeptidase/acylaminoacyl peptidase